MSRPTLDPASLWPFRVRGFHTLWPVFPGPFHFWLLVDSAVRTPKSMLSGLGSVWALPRSLAATYGITFVFSSSGYLDVSVHRVPSINLWIQLMVL